MTPRRALTVDDLAALPVLSDPQLSPDGRLAAYVVTTADLDQDRYTSAIWCVPTDGHAPPVRLTKGPQDTSPRWSPDGAQLAFVSGRGDRSGLFLMPLKDDGIRMLAMRSGIADPQWSPDGTHIAVTSVTGPYGETAGPPHAPVVVDRLGYKVDSEGLVNNRRSHVFIVEVASGATRQLTEGDFSVRGVRWSPDGEHLALAATKGGVDAAIEPMVGVFIVSATDGNPVSLTPATSLLTAPSWFPDGKHLLVCGQSRVKSGHNSLFKVAITGTSLQPVAEIDRNVMLGAPGYPGAAPFVLADESVLFMVRDQGCTHLYASDPGAEPVCLVGGSGRSLSGLSVAGGRMVYLVADTTTNGELYAANLDGTGERRLTRHFADALPDVELPTPAARTFATPDGTTVQGWVLRAPETVGASPLLLDIHGGPHNSWGPAFDGVHLYHHELVTRGWTVLLVNPRGSDGYGEAFYASVSGNWGLADEHDLLAPVDALIQDGLVDGNKVVVTGYSYGGFMSCWLSARHPDRWAASIPGGAVTDLTSMAGTSDLAAFLCQTEFGQEHRDVRERWRARSPLTYSDQVTTPTLLLHGEHDDRCPVGQAELWFTALHTRQVPVTLVRYPDASHEFTLHGRPSHRHDWCKRIADFAIQHGNGRAASAAACHQSDGVRDRAAE